MTAATVLHLTTPHTSYLIGLLPTGQAAHLYYGPRLAHRKDWSALLQPRAAGYGTMVTYDRNYPTYGLDEVCLETSGLGKGDFREPMVELEGADGQRVTDFVVRSWKQYAGKQPLPGLPSSYGDCETTEILLYEATLKVELVLCYSAFTEYDVIARSARLRNAGSGIITIRRLLSAQLDMEGGPYTLLTFDGMWGNERIVHSHPLSAGTVLNDSKTGHSSARHNPFVILRHRDADESHGLCYGCNLVYSGSHAEYCETSYTGKVRLLSGINPSGFGWQLAPGDSFQTPEAVLSCSDKGLNGLSQNFHRFINNCIVRGSWKNRPRPILINNWEATGFSFTEQSLLKMARTAADLGVELFVLDDGWFGRRNNDHCSLGDWTVNVQKLPSGLAGFAGKLRQLGLDFGLWVEPEMVSPDSDLYRAHPDWAVACPGRLPSESRNQYILDLGRGEVQEYLITTLKTLFASAPISYVKWDMNRNFSDFYAAGLPAGRQGEFFHRYILGLYRVLEQVTSAFPDILFESCASGGNRFDLGMLCYMPQIWTSDDTDARQRLAIQEGTSYGYPQSVMGAHVSASPNFISLRSTPLETRFNVAAFGAFGYELDLSRLSRVEKQAVRRQIAWYKEHRQLLQFGDFYRLRAGQDPDKTVWVAAAPDGSEAAAMLYQQQVTPGRPQEILPFAGLDPEKEYIVTGRPQYLELAALGELVNRVLPVKLRHGGVAQALLAGQYSLEMNEERLRAGGDLLCGWGLPLPDQFAGTGYNERIRLFGDDASRIYYAKAKD